MALHPRLSRALLRIDRRARPRNGDAVGKGAIMDVTLATLVDPPLFRLYLAAATVLVLIPGPDTLLVIGRSLCDGHRAGWLAAAGITAGNIVHASLAAFGVSAVIAGSPALFDAVRLGGGLYLLWLGASALRAAWAGWRRGETLVLPALGHGGQRQILAQAFATNILNPKVILFYIAFVPQFVAPRLGHVGVQSFVLGLVLAGLGLAWLALIAVLAASASRRLTGSPAVRAAIDGTVGLVFLGFAARLLLTPRHGG